MQTQAVLAVFLERLPDAEDLWGFELSKASGLAAGTIYPILQRLTASGWVADRWENPESARAEKRPPRRYYRLTVEGRARAVHALGEVAPGRAGLARLLLPHPEPETRGPA